MKECVEENSVAASGATRPTRIGVTGLSSNVGKTTLVCRLLRSLPGWEAIKISRGHYRSCGKDPHACCISPLLGERPLILSGKDETYAPGKDTGRYWDSGAGNVHWVICANHQVEEGITIALDRVRSEGVLIEGTSFLRYVQADYAILVVNPSLSEIKSSALSVLGKMNAIYIDTQERIPNALDRLRENLQKRGATLGDLPVYFASDLTQLVEQAGRIHLNPYGCLTSGASL